MKKLINLFLLLVAFSVNSMAGVITLKTSLAPNTKVSMLAWSTSIDDAITIDWGDGVEKTYNVDPDAAAWSKWIREYTKGDYIIIKGNLMHLQLREAQLTSVNIDGMEHLVELDLSENQINNFTCNDMPSLKKLNLSTNELPSFDSHGLSELSELRLNSNKISSFNASGFPSVTYLDLSQNLLTTNDFFIEPLAATLKELKINENKLVTLNLINFTSLENFTAMKNPDLTTVVFNDGNPYLKSIDMSDCYIMHFYAISLPSLKTLQLSNNALLELEKGNYPKLEHLALSGNNLTSIDVTAFTKLNGLTCADNKLTSLNLSNNPDLAILNCSNNMLDRLDILSNTKLTTVRVQGNKELKKLDITHCPSVSQIDISNTKISNIDLTNAYYLENFKAANTLCKYFYFNYINCWGKFSFVDIRNNKNMTSNSVTFTLRTMPGRMHESKEPTILLEGSNAEHANTTYICNSDMQWLTDVVGDGTAKNEDVDINVDAELTGEKISVTGEFGGMTQEQTFEFSEYSTLNGKFTLSQWSGPFYQQLADVTTTAKSGVAIHVTPYPAEGYVYDGVLVNDVKIDDEWFVADSAATIKVLYKTELPEISFTTGVNQPLSIALSCLENNTPIEIDWGNGGRQEYILESGKWNRIDGAAAAEKVTIYGNVNAVNFESYGEFGEEIGLWNNKITSVDFSKNNMLEIVNLYMNPIKTLDVSNLQGLTQLDCSYCELSELNVSGLSNLVYLYCYGNELTDLDVSGNIELYDLNAKVNKLSSLDLTKNTKLLSVNLSQNQIENIDLRTLDELLQLNISGNKIKNIDLSSNNKLLELGIANNLLTELDLTNNSDLQKLSFDSNNIKWIDLHNLTNLKLLNATDNGMTACELDDFYFNLPMYPELSDNEKDDIIGSTLTISQGTDKNPNDAEHSDTYMATSKGWTTNVSGDASGCNKAHLIIAEPINGKIEVVESDGTVVKSGDKVLKNSPITVNVTPDYGYEFDYMILNNKTIEGTTFSITRMSNLKVLFKMLADAINNTEIEGVSIITKNSIIEVSLPEISEVEVYSTDGSLVYSNVTDSRISLSVTKGLYIVKVKNYEGEMVRTVYVK